MLTLIAFILLFSNVGYACTMYKITQDGKTIVRNNEDWINANAEIWFVPAGEDQYGVMNLGFDDGFTQGAINEAGLVFDAFAMPYMKVTNTKGKTKTTPAELIAPIMHNYSNVIEVKDYLSNIDLSILDNTLLVFIDRSGQYLIVEGEELILGNDSEQSFSNFYPSLTSSREEVQIPSYQNGLKQLKDSASEATLSYGSTVMNSFKQSITQYTSVYDLQEGKIRVYQYQNFQDFLEFDLSEELKKGAHKLSIPELFPSNTRGFEYYETYNDADKVVSYYKGIWKSMRKKVAPEQLIPLEQQITQMINWTADDWVKTNKDQNGAIKIYRSIIELFPENKKAKKAANKKIKRIIRQIEQRQ